MKKYLISLLILFFITGCTNQQQITGSVIKEQEIICNSPYIRYADSCCLDKNYNDICDKDETTPSENIVSEETIQDSCTDTSYFECLGSYITKEEVFLKLKAIRDGYTHIKKVEIPKYNCFKEFDESNVSSGLKFNNIIDIKVPCKIDKSKLEDEAFSIELIFYPRVGIDEDTGEWLGKPRGTIFNKGTITGTVKEEAPKLI